MRPRVRNCAAQADADRLHLANTMGLCATGSREQRVACQLTDVVLYLRFRPSRVVRGRRLTDELKMVTAILEQPLIEKILTRLGLQARARPHLVELAPLATHDARRRGCGCAEAPLARPPLAAVQSLWSRRPRSLPGRAADTYGRRTRLERPAFPSSSLTS